MGVGNLISSSSVFSRDNVEDGLEGKEINHNIAKLQTASDETNIYNNATGRDMGSCQKPEEIE